MIRVTGTSFDATVNGVAVYLDNCAIINLAKHDPSRRRRFVDAVCTRRGDLGVSLDDIGPHWFPVEVDTRKVVQREEDGARPSESCIAKEFLVDYWNYQTKDYGPGSGKIIDLSQVLRLGGVLDWVGSQRDSIRMSSAELDAALINKINGYRM